LAASGKSPDAFRTISEVAEILDIPAHVLRFWESRFSQIKPVKRGGGRRYYRPTDIDLLRGIRDLLYSDGLTIKAVQTLLRQKGVKHVTGLGHLDPGTDPVQMATSAPKAKRPAAKKTAAAKPVPKPIQVEMPKPAPAVPLIDIKPKSEGPTQFDLFAQNRAAPRRAFPPDPAVAARQEKLRALLGKLQGLRAKMAEGLE